MLRDSNAGLHKDRVSKIKLWYRVTYRSVWLRCLKSMALAVRPRTCGWCFHALWFIPIRIAAPRRDGDRSHSCICEREVSWSGYVRYTRPKAESSSRVNYKCHGGICVPSFCHRGISSKTNMFQSSRKHLPYTHTRTHKNDHYTMLCISGSTIAPRRTYWFILGDELSEI